MNNHSTHVNWCDEVARRRHAHIQGDLARDARRISADAHALYERLITYTGGRTYCWPALTTIANEFAVHVRTIKRRIAELVAAKLITRVRRWATSWLTYICAYEDGPSQGTFLSPDPVKNPDPKGAIGGGKNTPSSDEQSFDHTGTDTQSQAAIPPAPQNSAEVPDTEQTRRLHSEGVTETLHLFANVAHSLIERAVRRASAVRDRSDPRRAGLIVYFLKKLITGAWVPDPDERHGTAGATAERRTLNDEHDPVPLDTDDSPPIDPQLRFLWDDVLGHVRSTLPALDFDTWIRPLVPLALEADRLIVGTPNIFVQQEAEDTYGQQIHAAVCDILGQPVELKCIVGGTQ